MGGSRLDPSMVGGAGSGPPTDTDAVIIGGGVVGTSLLRALAAHPGRWLLLEREGALARHASGRNSGVIHSGVYNRPGSIKAQLGAVGVPALYAYCGRAGVAHAR